MKYAKQTSCWSFQCNVIVDDIVYCQIVKSVFLAYLCNKFLVGWCIFRFFLLAYINIAVGRKLSKGRIPALSKMVPKSLVLAATMKCVVPFPIGTMPHCWSGFNQLFSQHLCLAKTVDCEEWELLGLLDVLSSSTQSLYLALVSSLHTLLCRHAHAIISYGS